METDLLGPPYEQRVIDLGDDDEGPVVATLVRRRAAEPTRRAVLWVHGWSDYFFQTHVADHFVALGFDFYALDLRKYGRSLLPHQTPAFCHSLADYVPELDEAARIIRAEDGHDTLLVAAHSTGGLIAALWAHRRRAARVVDALLFNSPFLGLTVPWWLRAPAEATARLGRRQPYGVLPRPHFPVYGHSLHIDHRGEWNYDLAWKPPGGFPIRFGWLAAVRAAQQRVQQGLSIDVPVLVACSTRSYRGRRWHEVARRADAVLDVNDIVQWAPMLGRHVTTLRVNGGVHDLTLSAAPVRDRLFSEIARWTGAYVAAASAPDLAAPAAAAPSGGRRARPAPRRRPAADPAERPPRRPQPESRTRAVPTSAKPQPEAPTRARHPAAGEVAPPSDGGGAPAAHG
jgi:alpha-beta hydrolase superfamily lysophospholipase